MKRGRPRTNSIESFLNDEFGFLAPKMSKSPIGRAKYDKAGYPLVGKSEFKFPEYKPKNGANGRKKKRLSRRRAIPPVAGRNRSISSTLITLTAHNKGIPKKKTSQLPRHVSSVSVPRRSRHKRTQSDGLRNGNTSDTLSPPRMPMDISLLPESDEYVTKKMKPFARSYNTQHSNCKDKKRKKYSRKRKALVARPMPFNYSPSAFSGIYGGYPTYATMKLSQPKAKKKDKSNISQPKKKRKHRDTKAKKRNKMLVAHPMPSRYSPSAFSGIYGGYPTYATAIKPAAANKKKSKSKPKKKKMHRDSKSKKRNKSFVAHPMASRYFPSAFSGIYGGYPTYATAIKPTAINKKKSKSKTKKKNKLSKSPPKISKKNKKKKQVLSVDDDMNDMHKNGKKSQKKRNSKKSKKKKMMKGTIINNYIKLLESETISTDDDGNNTSDGETFRNHKQIIFKSPQNAKCDNDDDDVLSLQKVLEPIHDTENNENVEENNKEEDKVQKNGDDLSDAKKTDEDVDDLSDPHIIIGGRNTEDQNAENPLTLLQDYSAETEKESGPIDKQPVDDLAGSNIIIHKKHDTSDDDANDEMEANHLMISKRNENGEEDNKEPLILQEGKTRTERNNDTTGKKDNDDLSGSNLMVHKKDTNEDTKQSELRLEEEKVTTQKDIVPKPANDKSDLTDSYLEIAKRPLPPLPTKDDDEKVEIPLEGENIAVIVPPIDTDDLSGSHVIIHKKEEDEDTDPVPGLILEDVQTKTDEHIIAVPLPPSDPSDLSDANMIIHKQDEPNDSDTTGLVLADDKTKIDEHIPAAVVPKDTNDLSGSNIIIRKKDDKNTDPAAGLLLEDGKTKTEQNIIPGPLAPTDADGLSGSNMIIHNRNGPNEPDAAGLILADDKTKIEENIPVVAVPKDTNDLSGSNVIIHKKDDKEDKKDMEELSDSNVIIHKNDDANTDPTAGLILQDENTKTEQNIIPEPVSPKDPFSNSAVIINKNKENLKDGDKRKEFEGSGLVISRPEKLDKDDKKDPFGAENLAIRKRRDAHDDDDGNGDWDNERMRMEEEIEKQLKLEEDRYKMRMIAMQQMREKLKKKGGDAFGNGRLWMNKPGDNENSGWGFKWPFDFSKLGLSLNWITVQYDDVEYNEEGNIVLTVHGQKVELPSNKVLKTEDSK